MSAARRLVGIDVGGTFTDLFFVDESTGDCSVSKLPTSVENQSIALVEGIVGECELADIATIVHGTTTGTNAILERKGGKVGVITTAGFRDVLEMRRRDRPSTWGLTGNFEPLAPRDQRLEVSERTLASGEIKIPLDEQQVADAAKALLQAGAESVVIMFVNAYANAEHEQRARQIVTEIWPNDWINCSSDILPEIREFERASTTAMNAYLQPVVGRYLDTMSKRLKSAGFDGSVFIVQSNGGVMTLDTAATLPVRTALSGPAAGVTAAASIASAVGIENVITCDLGGTSFDVSLIANGESVQSAQTTIDFGLVIRTPMVEITTIGAGGGSIAGVDAGGILQVGPQSAGSRPGPACYALGNTRPTLTDAHLLLGRINAQQPIGGSMQQLDIDAARTAIDTHVAKPLGLESLAAAEAIVRVANSRMAGAIRLVSIERGFDPKQFAIMPFGGGGGLHTSALMTEAGLLRGLVPRYPGITSAMGCLMADMRHDRVQTVNLLLDDTDLDALAARMRTMASEMKTLVDEAQVSISSVDMQFEFDMSYVGQTHAVSVPIKSGSAARVMLSVESVQQAFERRYKQVYSRTLEGQQVRIDAVRIAVIGHRPDIDLSRLAPVGGSVEEASKAARDIWIDGGWQSCRIYDRLKLPVGAVIPGPAVFEQPDTTIVIEGDHQGTVDALGNLLISANEAVR